MMCMGGLVAPIHLTKGPEVLVALQGLFIWSSQILRSSSQLLRTPSLPPSSDPPLQEFDSLLVGRFYIYPKRGTRQEAGFPKKFFDLLTGSTFD